MHQIFSTDKYILNISSTFENLYKKQFHRERMSNEVDYTLVFKRVKRENFPSSSLYGTKPTQIFGDTMAYLGVRYDVYVLSDKYLRGYMIIPKRGLYSSPEDPRQRIYFEFERKER